MKDAMLKLPVGLRVEGELVKEARFARTGGPAEEVYTTKPGSTTLYTWFGEVLSVSIEALGRTQIAGPFLKTFDKSRKVSKAVQNISLNDVGTALLQIQRHCWQDILEARQFACQRCGVEITADVDLNKIEVEWNPTSEYLEVIIHLGETYEVGEQALEGLKDLEGQKFNAIRFRPPLLGDAMRHEKLMVDELLFWRNIAFDCIVGFRYYHNVGTEEEPREEFEDVLDGYQGVRGQQLFTVDLAAKDLRTIRAGVTNKLPGAKFYYEDTCACGRFQVPFFTRQSDFFS